jgi:hypothetical protein
MFDAPIVREFRLNLERCTALISPKGHALRDRGTLGHRSEPGGGDPPRAARRRRVNPFQVVQATWNVLERSAAAAPAESTCSPLRRYRNHGQTWCSRVPSAPGNSKAI